MIGKQLREIRLRKGISQRQAAKELGVTYGHISHLETDKRDYPNTALCKRMDIFYGLMHANERIKIGTIGEMVLSNKRLDFEYDYCKEDD